MSLSRGCEAVEFQPGQWYCIVAQDEYDYEFQDYAVYGPKPTADAAIEEMHKYECNPGGWSETPFDQLTSYWKKLIEAKRR